MKRTRSSRIGVAVLAALWLLALALPVVAIGADPVTPGPPFPDPVTDQAVYDYAGVFSETTIDSAESTIDAIEARTGVEIAVYSQVVDYGVSTEETETRARALIDQWGIGRAGFDDGLVIFFDLDPSLEHGQVQLYAAPGFEATYLSNSQRLTRPRSGRHDVSPWHHRQFAGLVGEWRGWGRVQRRIVGRRRRRIRRRVLTPVITWSAPVPARFLLPPSNQGVGRP